MVNSRADPTNLRSCVPQNREDMCNPTNTDAVAQAFERDYWVSVIVPGCCTRLVVAVQTVL